MDAKKSALRFEDITKKHYLRSCEPLAESRAEKSGTDGVISV